jgi:serine/threonine protein kinase
VTPAPHFTHFGKYEIIRKLGRSMADVYLAFDPDENRRVVLKLVEQCRDSYTQQIMDAERRGASIQQQLHQLDPRILEIYDFGEQNGCFYVVMQYVEGRNLADLLRRAGRFEPATAARYAAEIANQLASLHSFQADLDGQKRAVVHGDIKPSNIQIGLGGEVWLLDFGIAKAITATRNLTHHNLGSPAYCSPERLKNAQVDPQADLWAVGVCLYEMIAGLPPYQAQTTRKLENLIQSRRPPRALPNSCPAPLQAIIWKALAADSSRRYACANDLEHDLRAFLAGQRTAAESEKHPSWDANATLEKSRRALSRTARPVRAGVAHLAARYGVVIWSLLAGLLVGLLCFVPASHAYRYWNESEPLRDDRSYADAAIEDIESDWTLLARLSGAYAWLGDFSPASQLRSSMRARLVDAADRIIAAYRNGPDGTLAAYDWSKARACLAHAAALDPSSREIQGKLALCDGYVALAQDSGAAAAALPHFERAAAALPASPDPHLALARVYIYAERNVGRALAEFHAAERLGYRLGPREMEQQADGYLSRAEQELRRFRAAKTGAAQKRYLGLFQRDIERARNLYEPIAGYSDVDQDLDRIEAEVSSAGSIVAARQRARVIAARSRVRRARWR